MPIALAILGVSGKMGRRVLKLAQQDPKWNVVGGLTRSEDSDLQTTLQHCDVAIDFTSREATALHLESAIKMKKPLVIGTTGHGSDERRAIEEASQYIPILFSPNFSFGVALCLEAVARLSRALYGSCIIDIFETHHTQKKDSPSGTALAFAQAVGQGTRVLHNAAVQPRKQGEIAIHSIRAGDVIGEHHIVFECGHERIELKHTAHSRDAFAKGALIGAKFLVEQSPGLYSLKNLFESN